MFDIWIRAITRPWVDTYEAFLQEESNPTLGKAAAWMALAAAIGWVISVVLTAIFGGGLIQFDILTLVCGIVAAPFGAVVGFVIGSAILLVAARLLGGDGTFVHQSYLLAAAYAPMSIISTIVVAIPVVGLVLTLAASLYALWLAAIALQAAHGYSRGRAVLTVLAPTLLVFVPICVIAILLLIGPAVGNVFSTIVDSI